MTHALYWMTNDLRMDDNPALLKASEATQLTIVYCLDPTLLSPGRYQTKSLGGHRLNFIRESLDALSQQLALHGQTLNIFIGDPEEMIVRMAYETDVDALIVSRQFGWHERQTLVAISEALPSMKIHEVDSYTLYSANDLPFSIQEWPKHFTNFKLFAETEQFSKPLAAPSSLPHAGEPSKHASSLELEAPSQKGYCPFDGGEGAAISHLREYIAQGHPKHYKDVRNELEGWTNSSKLSPWLNQGCLSVRRVKHELKLFEEKHGENESTHWLFLELLWREYFQWLALKLGKHLFHPNGAHARKKLNSFYPERFQKWCEGTTPYAIVNACMRQLKRTGYLSNRGRQIVASALVNELQVDWRYGAAWFEEQLVDYDVAVNWGNWQYIAGVGADPRGGRHFNLEKQAHQYDPDGTFRKRWAGEGAPSQLDSRDAADWPIMPKGSN